MFFSVRACITDGYKNYTTALKSFLKDDVDAQAAKPPAPKL